MIRIRYFARLREALGRGEEEIALPDGVASAGALRDWLCERGEPWRDALSAPAVLVAINQESARPETPVADGDEVAFFPPVTGG
jgi:molybdopterin synthase sulfur carrier subunit